MCAQPAAPLPGQEDLLLVLLLGTQSAAPAGGALPPPVLALAPMPRRPGGGRTLGGLTYLGLVREFMKTFLFLLKMLCKKTPFLHYIFLLSAPSAKSKLVKTMG